VSAFQPAVLGQYFVFRSTILRRVRRRATSLLTQVCFARNPGVTRMWLIQSPHLTSVTPRPMSLSQRGFFILESKIERQAKPNPVPQPPFQITVVMEYLTGTKTASKRSSLVVMGKWSPAGLFRTSPPGQPHSLMGLSPQLDAKVAGLVCSCRMATSIADCIASKHCSALRTPVMQRYGSSSKSTLAPRTKQIIAALSCRLREEHARGCYTL
jgi:hypothetical protein